jgi:hypothetical protein
MGGTPGTRGGSGSHAMSTGNRTLAEGDAPTDMVSLDEVRRRILPVAEALLVEGKKTTARMSPPTVAYLASLLVRQLQDDPSDRTKPMDLPTIRRMIKDAYGAGRTGATP